MSSQVARLVKLERAAGPHISAAEIERVCDVVVAAATSDELDALIERGQAGDIEGQYQLAMRIYRRTGGQ